MSSKEATAWGERVATGWTSGHDYVALAKYLAREVEPILTALRETLSGIESASEELKEVHALIAKEVHYTKEGQ